jgi:hypothetical protein
MKKSKYEFFHAFDVLTQEKHVIAIMDRLAALDPLAKDFAQGFLGPELFNSVINAGELKPSADGRFSIAELDEVLSGGLFFHMQRDDAAQEMRVPLKALDALSETKEGPAFDVVHGIRFYRITSVREFADELPSGSVKHAVRVPIEFWEEFEIM